MSDNTGIEWTDATWNPVTGCTKISAGCDHCYAERFSERFRGVDGNYFSTGFDLTLRPQKLDQPVRWKRPRRIFVNSMSDLFHAKIPRSYVDQVFDVMEHADWHTYQILTKRSLRMQRYLVSRYGETLVPAHIWMGVSIENWTTESRMLHLQATRTHRRFLSLEPLIGPVDLHDLHGIHWIIVGGESGPGARPLNPGIVRTIRDRCVGLHIPFFFKQWGGRTAKAGGKELDGREWCEMPEETTP